MDKIIKILLLPNELFKEKKENEKRVIIVFFISFIIVILKSFFRKGDVIGFSSNNLVNNFLTFVAIPQVAVLIRYLCYFLFTYLLFQFIKKYTKNTYKIFILQFMSLSSIGIVAHIITFPLNFIAQSAILPLFWLLFIWIIVLSILSIKKTSSLSSVKILFYLIIAAILPTLITGCGAITPYLAYMKIWKY